MYVEQKKDAAIADSHFLRVMTERDVHTAVSLIGRAMNSEEGRQAQETFRFHFSCVQHGINDGRRYYVLMQGSTVQGIAGLHHYVWGPPENVWLAWFAVDPVLQGRGIGTLLLEAMTYHAKELGYAKLFIETYSSPEFAQARTFYRERGFAQAGRVEAYLPDGSAMLVFYKDLTNHV